MSMHHPDEQWLNEFASGSLPVAHALCVSTHLSYCPLCRTLLQELNGLGGALLESLTPEPVSDALFDEVLSVIEYQSGESSKSHQADTSDMDSRATASGRYFFGDEDLPEIVNKLLPDKGLDGLPWARVGKTLRFSRVPTGDTVREASLYRIAPGGKIADHTHKGIEITVVLKGSFSDADGVYQPGDFIVRDQSSHHSPIATMNGECLCLSVLDSPVAFTGWRRILNPFLSVQPQ